MKKLIFVFLAAVLAGGFSFAKSEKSEVKVKNKKNSKIVKEEVKMGYKLGYAYGFIAYTQGKERVGDLTFGPQTFGFQDLVNDGYREGYNDGWAASKAGKPASSINSAEPNGRDGE